MVDARKSFPVVTLLEITHDSVFFHLAIGNINLLCFLLLSFIKILPVWTANIVQKTKLQLWELLISSLHLSQFCMTLPLR